MLLQEKERGASWGEFGELGRDRGFSASLSTLSLGQLFCLLFAGRQPSLGWGWGKVWREGLRPLVLDLIRILTVGQISLNTGPLLENKS